MALVFDVVKAKGKPDDNRRPGTSCPFCDVDGLENIIRRDGDRIWLQNKFRTLAPYHADRAHRVGRS